MVKGEEAELIIVGAGPTGLITAWEAANRGIHPIIIEEHKKVGVPCHCAGLISLKALSELDISRNENFIQNKFRGARLFSPSGLSFTIEKKRAVACVVERVDLDRFLAKRAVRAGAEIKYGWKANHIERIRDGVIRLRGDKWSINANLIVDAEGVYSRLLKRTSLKPLGLDKTLPALQFDLIGVNLDPDYVEIHLGRRVAPGFFAWVIPLSEDSARVGLACRGANPRRLLEKFIKRRFHGKNLSRISIRSGRVTTGGPLRKTYTDNLIVVGDAAGQVKPLTGGGIFVGGVCARIAGWVVADAIKRGRVDSAFLSRYEALWKEKLGTEFTYTRLVRRIIDKFSDRTIDKIFRVIIGKDLERLISLEGDMDMHGYSIIRMMRKAFWKILPIIIINLARDIMGEISSKHLEDAKLSSIYK